MVCPNCNAVLPEDAANCDSCGYDFSLKEVVSEKKEKPEKKHLLKGRGKQPQKHEAPSRKKIIPAIVILLLVIICAVSLYVYYLVAGSTGRKTADKISETLGRTVSMAEKNASVTFAQSSRFEYLSAVCRYDYIVESEKDIRVCGITVPEWAVFVITDGDSMIDEVVYCDFARLSGDWKGQKLNQQLYTSVIEYGMDVKQVEKALGFKPFYIVRNVNDVTTYCYKYYYVDPETGNDRAYCYWVDFNLDNQVSGIKTTEIDMIDVILAVRK